MYHGVWFGAGWIGAFWIALVGVIALVLWLISSGRRGTPHLGGPAAESPEDILKKRYARGELDTEQYHERLQELRR